MPLSIQQIPNMSRDELTLILAGGLVGGAILLGLVLFLNWRHRSGRPQGVGQQAKARMGRRRRKEGR